MIKTSPDYDIPKLRCSGSCLKTDGKRVPFSWPAFSVSSSDKNGRILEFQDRTAEVFGDGYFRISVAIDYRNEALLDLYIPESGRSIGEIDIRYPHILQPFKILIQEQDVQKIYEQGLGLRLVKGDEPLWFFSPNKTNPEYYALQPHLFFGKNKKSKDVFYQMLFSTNSIQQFGWMEGCVMEGLYDLYVKKDNLSAFKTLKNHIRHFLNDDGELIYEDPRSNPVDNMIYGIECNLPFAVLAKMYPKHPILKIFEQYCLEEIKNKPSLEGDNITTEGCYTLAYPIAVLAEEWNRPDLAEIALEQLNIRCVLASDNDSSIYQRLNYHNKKLNYRNWARGVSWYLLGLIKTIIVLETSFPEMDQIGLLKDDFIKWGKWASDFQNKQGLWYCFLDRKETLPDTSGSAGIAAALSIGAKYDLLPEDVKMKAKLALEGIFRNITQDGFVKQVAQSNKGGIALQESGYRVISQYSSGLIAQLIASLPSYGLKNWINF